MQAKIGSSKSSWIGKVLQNHGWMFAFAFATMRFDALHLVSSCVSFHKIGTMNTQVHSPFCSVSDATRVLPRSVVLRISRCDRRRQMEALRRVQIDAFVRKCFAEWSATNCLGRLRNG